MPSKAKQGRLVGEEDREDVNDRQHSDREPDRQQERQAEFPWVERADVCRTPGHGDREERKAHDGLKAIVEGPVDRQFLLALGHGGRDRDEGNEELERNLHEQGEHHEVAWARSSATPKPIVRLTCRRK